MVVRICKRKFKIFAKIFLLISGFSLIPFARYNYNYNFNVKTNKSVADQLIDFLVDFTRVISLEEPNVFAVFENGTQIFTTDHFKFLIKKTNLRFKLISSQDSRLLRKYRIETQAKTILTHVIIHSQEQLILHICVLIPRSDYYWIGPMPTDKSVEFIWDNLQLRKWLNSTAIDGSLLNNLEEKLNGVWVPKDQSTFQWLMQYSKFLECNYEENVWPFWSYYGNSADSYDTPLVQNALKFAREISINNYVPLQLYGGTLLGWFRQCDFIPYTKDLDLITNLTYMTDSFFRNLLSNEKFKLTQRFGVPNLNLGLEISGFFQNQLKMDLFTWLWENNTAYAYYYLIDYYAVQRLAYPQSSICTCDLLGTLAFVPCDPTSMIITEYGNKWFEPIVGALSRNFTTFRLYQDVEDDLQEYRQIYHQYEILNCSNPVIMYGCDSTTKSFL